MKSTVSLLGCRSYDSALVARSLAEAVERAGGLDVAGATVLVKPNLLNANGYERAVTSHPELVAATVRWLKSAGASRILVGDSPGFQSQDLVGKKSGVRDAALSCGAEWVDCSDGRELENPEGRLVKRFTLAHPFFDADLLVDLPRLKTHQLMYFTGAIKNLFGLIPGLQKSAFHLRFPGRREFGAMLADLALACAPDFTIMDGIVAMEGPGPNNGRPKELGLILASRDPLALDWVAADIIGYEPHDIPYLPELLSRGGGKPGAVRSRWIGSPDDIEVAGLSIEEARPASFDLVPIIREGAASPATKPGIFRRLATSVVVPRPSFDEARCSRCGACVKICPAKALVIAGGKRARVEIDYKACLRCYCCHEVCPEDAIRLVRRVFAG